MKEASGRCPHDDPRLWGTGRLPGPHLNEAGSVPNKGGAISPMSHQTDAASVPSLSAFCVPPNQRLEARQPRMTCRGVIPCPSPTNWLALPSSTANSTAASAMGGNHRQRNTHAPCACLFDCDGTRELEKPHEGKQRPAPSNSPRSAC